MQKVQTKKQRHPAIKMIEAAKNNRSVTNNTDTDLLVLHAFTNDASSVAQLYEQSLKI